MPKGWTFQLAQYARLLYMVYSERLWRKALPLVSEGCRFTLISRAFKLKLTLQLVLRIWNLIPQLYERSKTSKINRSGGRNEAELKTTWSLKRKSDCLYICQIKPKSNWKTPLSSANSGNSQLLVPLILISISRSDTKTDQKLQSQPSLKCEEMLVGPTFAKYSPPRCPCLYSIVWAL